MFADRRRLVALSLVLLSSGIPDWSAAQVARDPAAAEALYMEARGLLARKDWPGACAKFEASMALDPVASTLINIARCREHEGKLAQAWAEYQRALVLNQETPGERRRRTLAELAKGGLEALEGRVPRLRIDVEPAPAGLSVTRDGVEVPRAALGTAVPVDPGEHRIVASAPGYQAAEQRARLAEGEIRPVTLRLLPKRDEAPPRGPAAETVPGDPHPTSPAPTEPNDVTSEPEDGSIPAWVWGVGGLGLACIGTAVAFRVDAAAADARLEEKCGPTRVCAAEGDYDPKSDNARKDRGFALFVGLGAAGLVGLGAATVGGIVVTTSRGSRTSVSLAPSITRHGGGLRVRGSY